MLTLLTLDFIFLFLNTLIPKAGVNCGRLAGDTCPKVSSLLFFARSTRRSHRQHSALLQCQPRFPELRPPFGRLHGPSGRPLHSVCRHSGESFSGHHLVQVSNMYLVICITRLHINFLNSKTNHLGENPSEQASL